MVFLCQIKIRLLGTTSVSAGPPGQRAGRPPHSWRNHCAKEAVGNGVVADTVAHQFCSLRHAQLSLRPPRLWQRHWLPCAHSIALRSVCSCARSAAAEIRPPRCSVRSRPPTGGQRWPRATRVFQVLCGPSRQSTFARPSACKLAVRHRHRCLPRMPDIGHPQSKKP